jgi:hypothetical protein
MLTDKREQFKLKTAPTLSNLKILNQSNELVFKKLKMQLYSRPFWDWLIDFNGQPGRSKFR